ncbi:MAG: hypothetical protein O2945_17360 [Planctomycetota bacterium]|nr:hypothetical protein [Planctomycetota bacterium]MDA0920842.1 hypothetical protein [Planctomycetota bacterium]
MSTQLGRLRSDLVRLRNTRQMIRGISGLSLLLQSALLILVGGFLLDWLLDMSTAQRCILLTLMAVVLAWSFHRFAKPWFGQSEDLIELALDVEQRHGLDNDLVSALQFEQPEAATWGSTQLESAVITQVAELTPQIKVFDGLSFGDFKRRMIILAVVVAVPTIVSGLFPGYFHAYLNRMLLGAAQYPTATQIVEVLVNGQAVLDANGRIIREVTSPFGHALSFQVHISGQRPPATAQNVRIQSLDGAVSTEVQLRHSATLLDSDANPAADSLAIPEGNTLMLSGELPRLMDSVTIQVFAGDARSAKITVHATPLPVVEPELSVTPPEYVRAVIGSPDATESKLALSVVEGSRIDLTVRSLNKPLEMVGLTIGESDYQLTPKDAEKREWTLNVSGTEFQNVSETLRYQIQATDAQGLQLENPIHGTIRLRTDQPPRLAISARTRAVVATAQPPITWSASDDFGLSRIFARIQVARADGEISETEVEVASNSDSGKPQTSLRGTHPLDLSSLKLVKGDELKVTFAAYDYRGDAEPAISYSEPIQLQLTDRQGILSGLLETDEESARQLDAIIRRELGIGDTK